MVRKAKVNSNRRYMAMDQYGHCHHDLIHPRKELMELYGVNKTSKMFQETVGGNTYHTGYVIKVPESCSPGFEHWFTIYEVKPWRKLP